MFARVLSIMLVLALAGCGTVERGPSSSGHAPSGGLRLPASIVVDDGHNGSMPLQMASLVAGGGLNGAFGSRGYSMGGRSGPRHDGIDIRAPKGTAIHAATDGQVVDLGWRGDYGRFILLRHSDQIETAYAHLSRFADRLAVGQVVRRDQVIGYVGTSGNATGPHLHFEVRRNGRAIDPLGASTYAADR
jgi:murein DD-endopeptidase MepM/ murein hydrolase activator NlpD